MVLNRIKQFWHALFSKVGPAEITFVKRYLNEQEQSLFFSMDRPTQTHCVRVARTCLKLLSKNKQVNEKVLIKSALLHDIGKPANLIKTMDRVLIVVMTTLTPRLYHRMLQDKLFSGHFYLAAAAHANHCLAGADIARRANLSPDVIYLIENHHRSEQAGEPPELKLLREADALN
ncbi:HDIG domain-containing metalloprotein [Desulforamulus putei]|uniref:HDIG domain-containing protein n=1 Tax=Desulforamulus putei DSM 12395 TaxID=1121429 RepID=A0A1M4TAK1_9FIRM|nr:HD domain-containing protein [Desulforamulus putei]SHE41562.1 HDIG domain-containing protein [Desulforamulus putei DSM 12395]